MTLRPAVSQPVLNDFFLQLRGLLERKERRASFAMGR